MRQAYRVEPSLTETWLDVEHAQELNLLLLDSDSAIYDLAFADPLLRRNQLGVVGGRRAGRHV